MNLNEILIVNKAISPNIDITKSKIIGSIEGHDIHQYNNTGIHYFIKNEKEIISSVSGNYINFLNSKFFVIKNIFTSIQYKGKGFASILFMFFLKKLHIKLMADIEMTLEGIRFWENISKQFGNSKVIDQESNTIFDRTEISDEQLFINGSARSKISDKYLLIMETCPISVTDIGNPPFNLYEESIPDLILYTDRKQNMFL